MGPSRGLVPLGTCLFIHAKNRGVPAPVCAAHSAATGPHVDGTCIPRMSTSHSQKVGVGRNLSKLIGTWNT